VNLNKTENVEKQHKIAIFFRLAGQIAGTPISEQAWLDCLQGYQKEPELFPLIEACEDAAAAILAELGIS
jgi:hypothetical protein